MKKWILLEKQKYFKGFGTLPDNLYMRGRTPPQELLFWSFFTPTQMLWHVRCDIAWNSLCANVTITRVIVTCELWHCLEQSLGQCHNHTPGCGMRVVTLPGTVFGPMSQSDPWLWHVACDIVCESLWANVTITRNPDCEIGPKTVPGNVTTHMSQSSCCFVSNKFERCSSHFHKIFITFS